MDAIIQQFSNLIDPATTLGAFLISLLAGIVGSFFCGYKYCEYTHKDNTIDVEGNIEGNVFQDKKKTSDSASSKKTSKKNKLKAQNITGDVYQDIEEE